MAGGSCITEALVALLPLEGCHGLPEVVDGPTIVTLGLVGLPEAVVRLRLRDAIATGRGESEGTLASGNGLVMLPPASEMRETKRKTCPSRR